MNEILTNVYVVGFVKGMIVGGSVDLAAFRSWKSFDEAAAYDWHIAAWRVFQGGVVGLLVTLGLG